MNFVLFILSVLLLLVVYIFTQTIRFRLLLNLDTSGFGFHILCLYPFLEIKIKIIDDQPFLLVHFFKITIYRKQLMLQKKTGTGKRLLRSADVKNINVNTRYGLDNPFSTGILCGALNIAVACMNIGEVLQFPNFISGDEFFYIDATADMNVGHTIFNFVKNKKGGRDSGNKYNAIRG